MNREDRPRQGAQLPAVPRGFDLPLVNPAQIRAQQQAELIRLQMQVQIEAERARADAEAARREKLEKIRQLEKK